MTPCSWSLSLCRAVFVAWPKPGSCGYAYHVGFLGYTLCFQCGIGSVLCIVFDVLRTEVLHIGDENSQGLKEVVDVTFEMDIDVLAEGIMNYTA
jgi:hypothetical protein